MDISMFEAYMSVPIVALCFCVGYVIKNSTVFGNLPNNNIPLIVTVIGGLFGLIMIGLTPEAFVIGVVSGLASTGIHQFACQYYEKKAGLEAKDLGPLEKDEIMDISNVESDGDKDE